MSQRTVPEWLDRALAPYRGVRVHGRLLDDVVSSGPVADRFDLLRSLALVVLRPDAVAGGRAAEVLHHLAHDARIVPLALRVACLGARGFDRLYRFKLHLFGDSIWLHHQIFDAGPAAILVVGGAPGAYGSLSERLNALKGASSPLDVRTPPSLRERFGRASAFHAVLHVSEDEGALVYETSTMFEPRALERLAMRCSGSSDVTTCGLPLPLCGALVSPDPPSTATVFQHALSVKRRIAAARLLGAREDGYAQKLWRITEEADSAISGSYHDQRAAFVSFTTGERQLLEEAMRDAEGRLPATLGALTASGDEHPSERWRSLQDACDAVQLLCASWWLSGFGATDVEVAERMWPVLERNSVPVSSWQRTFILAGLRADLTGDTQLPGRPRS